jgi:serine/threonine protein phosphatase 1
MKIFAASDIHSFYTPLKKELDKRGFEANNTEHLLVVCGDVFDRGSESKEVYEYLNNLTNVVLVKGNHESLMEEVWDRGHTLGHDYSNGTNQTIMDLFKANPNIEPYDPIRVSEKILRPFFAKFVNYFETKHYIFVHGWIPCDSFYGDDKPWYLLKRELKYNPNWRSCNDVEWESDRWINGINAGYLKNICDPNKTIVCGHWHCSYGHYIKALRKALKNGTEIEHEEFGETAIWKPFKAKGILAIDSCTAYTNNVNVVVLEDELIEEA